MERRTWITATVAASMLLSGCSGGSEAKGPTGTTPTMTSSESNNGSGTQTPSANGTTKAVPTLEPGQTGPATKELLNLNALLGQAIGGTLNSEEVGKKECTRLFGSNESIAPVLSPTPGISVVLSGNAPTEALPTGRPLDDIDKSRWILYCTWADETTPDARTTRVVQNSSWTPEQRAEDTDTKAAGGWAVVCAIAPAQWVDHPPQGNIFYSAAHNAKWPDNWDKQESRNGVTVGCRNNNMSAAQYGKTSKSRGADIDGRAVKLQRIALDALAKSN